MFEIADENLDLAQDEMLNQSDHQNTKKQYKNFQFVQIKKQKDGSKMKGREQIQIIDISA
jgi:hypothetical protein